MGLHARPDLTRRSVRLFAPPYVPGAGIPAGASFARTTEGAFRTAVNGLDYAPAGVLRDSHYVGAVRTLLLEPTATNLCPYSSPADVTAGRWQSFLSLAQAAVVGPDGIAGMAKQWHQNTANTDAAWYLPLGALIAGQQYRVSSYLKNAVDGAVRRRHHLSGATTGYSPDFLTSAAWARFDSVLSFTGAFANIGYRGGSTGNNLTVQCFGYQVELGNGPATSYIRNATGAALVRAADQFTLPVGGTLYEKYYDTAGALIESVRAYVAGSQVTAAAPRAYVSIKLGLGSYSLAQMRKAGT